MVVFLLLLLSIAGVLAYGRLGQKEDPEFTVKAMLVQAAWPGSSAQQMSEQVTDKLEKKLQEVAHANGIHIVSWWWTPGGFASKEREISGPASVAGMKMRAADPTFETMLEAAGASVVSIPSTEI